MTLSVTGCLDRHFWYQIDCDLKKKGNRQGRQVLLLLQRGFFHAFQFYHPKPTQVCRIFLNEVLFWRRILSVYIPSIWCEQQFQKGSLLGIQHEPSLVDIVLQAFSMWSHPATTSDRRYIQDEEEIRVLQEKEQNVTIHDLIWSHGACEQAAAHVSTGQACFWCPVTQHIIVCVQGEATWKWKGEAPVYTGYFHADGSEWKPQIASLLATGSEYMV